MKSGQSIHLHQIALFAIALLLVGCARREPAAEPASPARALRVLETKERPGLGTAWGEPRESWVEATYFARAWQDRPSGIEKIYYNDRDGVDAMLDYIGGEPRSVPGLQRAAGGMIQIGLRDGSGRWFETLDLRHQRFVIGERGSRYEVVLKNDSRRRVEVVVSVDGLDTLDGEPASVKKRGYVLAPRETLAVDGFRTSDGSVAAFRFINVGDTYAQRRYGDTGNVGVIGLAVFAERFLGTPADQLRPEHRAWRQAAPKGLPSSRRYATPPDA